MDGRRDNPPILCLRTPCSLRKVAIRSLTESSTSASAGVCRLQRAHLYLLHHSLLLALFSGA